jgi:hypothetical protein
VRNFQVVSVPPTTVRRGGIEVRSFLRPPRRSSMKKSHGCVWSAQQDILSDRNIDERITTSLVVKFMIMDVLRTLFHADVKTRWSLSGAQGLLNLLRESYRFYILSRNIDLKSTLVPRDLSGFGACGSEARSVSSCLLGLWSYSSARRRMCPICYSSPLKKPA